MLSVTICCHRGSHIMKTVILDTLYGGCVYVFSAPVCLYLWRNSCIRLEVNFWSGRRWPLAALRLVCFSATSLNGCHQNPPKSIEKVDWTLRSSVETVSPSWIHNQKVSVLSMKSKQPLHIIICSQNLCNSTQMPTPQVMAVSKHCALFFEETQASRLPVRNAVIFWLGNWHGYKCCTTPIRFCYKLSSE